jgi:hypothetical protein
MRNLLAESTRNYLFWFAALLQAASPINWLSDPLQEGTGIQWPAGPLYRAHPAPAVKRGQGNPAGSACVARSVERRLFQISALIVAC